MLDTAGFDQLAAGLECPDGAVSFMASYLEMLPSRIARILAAVLSGDPESSMDAVLSLRVSSGMSGACRLEQNCRELETALRASEQQKVDKAARRLTKDFDLLVPEIKSLLACYAQPVQTAAILSQA
ncbi:hypothetical protein IV498_17015 [Paenarthrobacter sp. Z7-10]|nr:hypothetical protein [Paenarthrobacter sp. Z7-10]